MTTVDVPTSAITERVDRMRAVDLRHAFVRTLVMMALFPFVLMGRTAKVVVIAAMYAVAAVQEGYAMQGKPRKSPGA